MSKKQYIGFIILAVAIFGSLFYWYSFRPSIIKQNCYKEAREKAIAKLNRGLNEPQEFFTKDDYDTYYKICLQAKGL